MAIVVFAGLAFADALVDKLATDDPQALAAAITEIEHAPTTPRLADTLLAAARACEDQLLDPERALAIYDRIVRELPDARVSIAAKRRAEHLRVAVGARGEHAREAAALAHLIATADRLPAAEVERRAAALAAASWPGAPDAGLWLAEWMRRAERWTDAQARYAAVIARWPGSPQATVAARDGAGNALEAHDWQLADELATTLPHADPADADVRADLIDAAARGRLRDRLVTIAWLALIGVVAALLGSLAEAALRGGRRRPSLRPPIEVMLLSPIAAVLATVAFTSHRAIAPAVTLISAGGIVLAWLSGITLELLAARDRSVRLRAAGHVLACVVGIAALGYLALMHDGLLDVLVETVRFGPEG